jgi:hypothetical protein
MPDADAAPALPDDVASLKAMVLAQTAELAEIRAQRQAQEAELAAARAGLIEQRFEIEALKSRLARLQRMTFGRSSEKLRDQVEQLELTLADIDEMLGEITPANDPADEQAEIPARKPARRPLPEALPRDIVEHAAPCACPGCGGALRPFGEDVTEILDYVPGSFRVSSAMSVRNCRAGRARRLSRRRLPACRSAVVVPERVYWRMCWWQNIATICRCIARLRSTPAKTSTSAARRWPIWSARLRDWCGH